MVKTAAITRREKRDGVTDNVKGVVSNNGGGRYKGVRMRKWGKWVAEVRQPNSRDRIWLGSYETALEAARAYDAAVFCLRGPSGKFNFPDDPPSIPGASEMSPAQIQVVASRHAHGMPPVKVEDSMSPAAESTGGFFGSGTTRTPPPPDSFSYFGEGELSGGGGQDDDEEEYVERRRMSGEVEDKNDDFFETSRVWSF